VATPDQHTRFTLLDESFTAADEYLYVYRDNGSGRPDGTHLKKYDSVISLEQLRADVGSGMFVMMQKTKAGNVGRKTLWIPPDDSGDQAPVAIEGDPDLSQLERILKMKMMADQLSPREKLDPLEIVRTILEATRSSNPLDAFLTGAEWHGPGKESNPLASIIETIAGNVKNAQVAEQTSDGAASVQIETIEKTASSIRQSIVELAKAMGSRLERQDDAINKLTLSLARPDPEEEGGIMITLLGLFTSLLENPELCDSPERVAATLRMADNASGGNVRYELGKLNEGTISEHVKLQLEAHGRGDLVDVVISGLGLYQSHG